MSGDDHHFFSPSGCWRAPIFDFPENSVGLVRHDGTDYVFWRVEYDGADPAESGVVLWRVSGEEPVRPTLLWKSVRTGRGFEAMRLGEASWRIASPSSDFDHKYGQGLVLISSDSQLIALEPRDQQTGGVGSVEYFNICSATLDGEFGQSSGWHFRDWVLGIEDGDHFQSVLELRGGRLSAPMLSR